MALSSSPRGYRFGPFEVDLRAAELRKHGIRLKLQDRPFRLLTLLLSRAGELLTREELRQELWQADTYVDFDHGLNNAVNRMRDVLGDSAATPRYIETVPRRGYRFVAAVEVIADAVVEAEQPAIPNRVPQPSAWRAYIAYALAAILIVTAFLAGRITEREPSQARAHGSGSGAALEVLDGERELDRMTPAGFTKAAAHFERALDADPNFASAHAGLAAAYNGMGATGAMDPNVAFERAKASARRALAIDPASAAARSALGGTLMMADFNWAAAEREMRLAIELDPEYIRGRRSYAVLLAAMGRGTDSVEQMQRALALAPESAELNADVGIMMYLARQYDEADEHLLRAIEIDRDYAPAYKFLSDTYLRSGREREAGENFALWLEKVGVNEDEVATVRKVVAKDGLPGVWRRIRGNPRNKPGHQFGLPYKMAATRALLGEKESAIELLEQALAQRDKSVIFIKVDPQFDSLRAEKRFQELVARIGL